MTVVNRSSEIIRISKQSLLSLLLYLAFIPLQAQPLKKESNFSQHQFIPCYNLKKIGNTTIFQGNKKKRKYFEGWYFKLVAADGSKILSVIPGLSLSANGTEQHAFIQLIDGVTAETRYFSFPIEDFAFSKKDFAISIGDNYFSKERMVLNLADSVTSVKGEIEMHKLVDYRSGRLFNTGIMGWYRFVPFMQCYHGVVSLSHSLKGQLSIGNETADFNDGKGYIEKDWGASMPSAWVWMQSNHFTDSTSSFMLSVADVPWLGKSFTGFLGFFYHDGQIHHFATYRRSKLSLEVSDENSLKIIINNPKNTLIVNARSNNSGFLKAPVEGAMDRRIAESIDANITIQMLDKKGQVVFSDSSAISGLELVGDFHLLQGLHQ